jgi:hypothetical protein
MGNINSNHFNTNQSLKAKNGQNHQPFLGVLVKHGQTTNVAGDLQPLKNTAYLCPNELGHQWCPSWPKRWQLTNSTWKIYIYIDTTLLYITLDYFTLLCITSITHTQIHIYIYKYIYIDIHPYMPNKWRMIISHQMKPQCSRSSRPSRVQMLPGKVLPLAVEGFPQWALPNC